MNIDVYSIILHSVGKHLKKLAENEFNCSNALDISVLVTFQLLADSVLKWKASVPLSIHMKYFTLKLTLNFQE